VEGNAKGVMCSYNALNGVPTCANEFLEHVMRDVWGFTGYITSDSGAIEDIYAQHKYKNMTAAEGVAAAIKAGTDVDSSLDNGSDATGSPYTWYVRAKRAQKEELVKIICGRNGLRWGHARAKRVRRRCSSAAETGKRWGSRGH
jgi:beta-glucosidase-like glycosyl hydrolase